VPRVQTTAVVILLLVFLFSPVKADVVNEIPFGPIEYIELPAVPTAMILAKFGQHSSASLIISYVDAVISITPAGSSNRDHITVLLDTPAEQLAAIENENGSDYLVVVPAGKPVIEVYRYDRSQRMLILIWSGKFEGIPYSVMAYDITGDGRSDILALFTDRPGIGILRGKGNGTFTDPEFFFEDVIVAQFEILDLNGDGLPDIVLYDPIKNTLRFHYGFGDLVFALERTMPLSGTVSRFAMLPLGDDTVMDLLVSFEDENVLAVYLGDGLGRYTGVQYLPMREPAHRIIYKDLFRNGSTDLVIFEKKTGSVSIYRNVRDRGFVFTGSLVIGSGVIDLMPVLNEQSGLVDLFFRDRNRNRITILRSLPSEPGYLPKRLALAGPPVQIHAESGNFDKTGDHIFILSHPGSAISVFWYDKDHRLRHRMIQAPGLPEEFYVYNITDDRTKILVLNKRSDLITVLSINWITLDANVYGIPAPPGSEVVYLGSLKGNRFQFGTLIGPGRSAAASFSLFEQFGEDEYIERNITPVTEERLVSLEAVDVSKNSIIDLAYLYNDKPGSDVYLALALSDSQYVFRTIGAPLTVGDSTVSRGFLVANGKKNSDSGITELIGYLERGGNRGRLVRATGTSSGALTFIDESGDDKLHIRSMRDIYMFNAFGKRFHDLVYLNAAKNRIECLPSDSTGLFIDPVGIFEGDSVTSFAVVRFFGSDRHLIVGRDGDAVVTVHRSNLIIQ
jgi:hypothetical protein